jgi:hypothetical protein
VAEDEPRDLEDEPLADADASECDADPAKCAVAPAERDGTAPESEYDHREEILETFKPRYDVMVPHPGDGMPVPRDETDKLSLAHPFTRETCVCVEDAREYVELFADELEARGWHSRDARSLGPTQRGWDAPAACRGDMSLFGRPRYDDDGAPQARRRFKPQEVVLLWGVHLVPDGVADDEGFSPYTPVRQVRERCRFYKRQLMANDDYPDPDEFGHLIFYRNCTKRRSVGGAFMTVSNEAVYACDYRQPYDETSVAKEMDRRDDEHLDGRRHLELIRPFGLKG